MRIKKFSDEEFDTIKIIKVGKWDIISEYHRIDWEEKGHGGEELKTYGTFIEILGY